jgi:hypothetical protein
MFRGVEDLFTALSMLLPPWAVAAVFVCVIAVVIPMWLKNLKVKRIRALARRMVRADADLRAQYFAEIMTLADTNPDRLESTAQVAIKYGVYDLRNEAIRRLEATGALPEALRKLRATFESEPKRALHPLEVAVNVEQLLSENMTEAAREQLDEGLVRFPKDAELNALRRRLGDIAS